MFKHIVVGTDGSDCAKLATDKAMALAKNQGAALTAVFVVTPYPYLMASEKQKFTESAKLVAEKTFEELTAQAGSGVSFNGKVIEAKSAEQAIEQVISETGADLLVVGSHGHSGLNRLLLGSVASKLITSSTIPVLVAK